MSCDDATGRLNAVHGERRCFARERAATFIARTKLANERVLCIAVGRQH